MTDLNETPPVPPTDAGGDERLGLQAAGALLIVVGFGLAVIGNIVLHLTAASTGSSFGPWTIFPTMGPYAWAVLILGFGSGLLGSVFLGIARGLAKGPAVLPGFPY